MHVSIRSSFPRLGTPSSSPCTTNTFVHHSKNCSTSWSTPVERTPTFLPHSPLLRDDLALSQGDHSRRRQRPPALRFWRTFSSFILSNGPIFVEDAITLAEEAGAVHHSGSFSRSPFAGGSDETSGPVRTDDIPFYTIGFKSAAPERTLRARIWLLSELKLWTVPTLVS